MKPYSQLSKEELTALKKELEKQFELRRLRYTGGGSCLGYCFGVRRNHVRGSGCGPTVPARYSIPDFTKKVITFL